MRDAADRTKRAPAHRAAARALRDAKARACVGIGPANRDVSPFHHREDIARVERFMSQPSPSAKSALPALRGATVVFRAVPGMTAEWLQRVVDCHGARNGALGHAVPVMPYCPLVPKGVTAKVTSTGDGFAVAVQADDPTTAEEVWKRAQALAATGEHH